MVTYTGGTTSCSTACALSGTTSTSSNSYSITGGNFCGCGTACCNFPGTSCLGIVTSSSSTSCHTYGNNCAYGNNTGSTNGCTGYSGFLLPCNGLSGSYCCCL